MLDFFNITPSYYNFINLFRNKTIKYVFAFRDENNRSLKDSPEEFKSNVAKFALVELEEKMRQLDKSELKILQIKNKISH